MELTIGADPEVFVKDHTGKYVSGHIFECGTKLQPMPTKHGSVQVDGVALECNVFPALTETGFLRHVTNVLNDLNDIVKAKGPYVLSPEPTVYLGDEFLKAVPPINRALGCDADWNPYTMTRNPAPDTSSPIRTGSGHIHIGWTKGKNPRDMEHFLFCAELAKELDYYIGLPSLMWDPDPRRRLLYGKAGAFRPKDYGLEYRVPSNAWLKTQKTIKFVFRNTIRAYQSQITKPLHVAYGDLAETLINNNTTEWQKVYTDLAGELQ